MHLRPYGFEPSIYNYVTPFKLWHISSFGCHHYRDLFKMANCNNNKILGADQGFWESGRYHWKCDSTERSQGSVITAGFLKPSEGQGGFPGSSFFFIIVIFIYQFIYFNKLELAYFGIFFITFLVSLACSVEYFNDGWRGLICIQVHC